jgi:adenosylhomocysteinase
MAQTPGLVRAQRHAIKGVTEETTTGVHRLYQMMEEGASAVPGDQRQRLGHQVEVRQQVRLQGIAGRRHPPRHRHHDGRQGRGGLRLWRRGQGLGGVLRGAGARVKVTEVDPICALQAAMDGFEVMRLEDVVATADIFITATGNKDVIRIEHMRAMKDMAIVGNIGHFDNEIQVAALKNHKWTNIKDQVDMIEMPSGNRIILLSEGRLLNLGNATGHPSFVMSASFTNQVLAQIELWTRGDAYRPRSTCCPSIWTRRSRGCTSSASA